jgi:tRNA-dihydrouridine synthase A
MARAAAFAEALGYDEVNVNVGCPSPRVVKGRFGACLMLEPGTVAASVAAMGRAAGLPVTVKSRIGVDDRDGYDDLAAFVETVAAAGCRTFVVHARKAWLSGLSPKENREVPPLRYEIVYRLKEAFPELEVVINGGIASLDAAEAHLARCDGVMLGRAAYQNPYLLADADRRLLGGAAGPDRIAVALGMIPYIERELAAGGRLAAITRHMLGLFQGQPGGRIWRRHLSEAAVRPGAGAEVLGQAVELVRQAAARAEERIAA